MKKILVLIIALSFSCLAYSGVTIRVVNNMTFEVEVDSLTAVLKSANKDKLSGKVNVPTDIEEPIDNYNYVETISQGAFANCTNITELNLPYGIKVIESAAFQSCTNLKYINIPERTHSIGELILEGCSNLQTIRSFTPYPPQVDGKLGDDSMYKTTTLIVPFGCSASYKKANGWSQFVNIKEDPIEEITINKLDYKINHEAKTATIVGVETSYEVVAPNTVTSSNGKTFPITAVADGAFAGCSCPSITLPHSITTIGDGAFQYCWELVYVNIPASTTYIGDYAFNQCPKLETIDSYAKVPPTVEFYTFLDINLDMVNVDVPYNCAQAYNQAEGWRDFFYLSAKGGENVVIDGITYSTNNPTNTAVVYSCPENKSGEVIIPKTITDPYGDIFPVVSIHRDAFQNVSDLTKVVLPSTITTLESHAFDECAKLEVIELLAKNPPKTEGNPFAWMNKSKIELCVPYQCSQKYLADPCWKEFGVIRENATEKVEQDGLTYEIFLETPSAILISCPKEKTGKVSIPSSVTTSYGTKAPVTQIAPNAFKNCGEIDTLICYATVPPVASENAFDKLVLWTTLYVPKGTTQEYNKAPGWKHFVYIKPMDMLEILQDDIFYFADPDNGNASVYMGKYNIQGNIEIASTITGPNEESYTVTGIEENAFLSRDMLTNITLPSTIERIGEKAFFKCTAIKSLTVKRLIPPTIEGLYTFAGLDKNIPVYIPAGTLALYQTAEIWEKFTNFIEEGPATAVDQVPDAPAFTIQAGTIITEGPVTIYNLVGQDVTAQNGQLQGVYILVQNGKSVKVVIK